jgi:hypothetical protein
LTPADGLHPWNSGYVDFDATHSIRTSDTTAMSAILSEVVQMQIARLKRIPRLRPLLIEISRGVLRVSKGDALYRAVDLGDFVRTSLELYDQMLLASSQGIEFLDGQAAQMLEHVVCQVCGEEIHNDLVFCRACKTPHHRECWLYNGRCSVFGCGELNFHVPRRAGKIVRQPPDLQGLE